MTTSPNFKRAIVCSSIVNFRDFGGYDVPGEGRLRTDFLFRSGAHNDATEADLDRVSGLSIGTIADLRGSAERELSPNRHHAGFKGEILSVAVGETSEAIAPHLKAAAQARTVAAVQDVFLRLYANMITLPHFIELCGRYVARLAEADQPSLIHCHTGKDRTGVAVAFLHRLLGVRPDDIMADFMLTNTAMAENMAYAVANLKSHVPEFDDQLAEKVFQVEPDYLHAAFAGIDRLYGGFDVMAEQRLGIDARKRANLRERLIV